jgi:hypothetical protein
MKKTIIIVTLFLFFISNVNAIEEFTPDGHYWSRTFSSTQLYIPEWVEVDSHSLDLGYNNDWDLEIKNNVLSQFLNKIWPSNAKKLFEKNLFYNMIYI